MKYAISTDGDEVCPHFGRAPHFTIINIKDNKLIDKNLLTNPGHTIGSIPKFISDQGVNCMITGGMGHRAVQFFNQYAIDVIVGISGKINYVIEKILDGTLEGGESICAPGRGKGYGIEKIHTEEDENDKLNHHH